MTEVTAQASSTRIDMNSVFYVHPSDNPGTPLVPTQFDGVGYRSWRRGILRALSVKNKSVFIDGSCVKPAENSPQSRQWQRCDDMVTSWILNSLTKEIADSVEYVNNSCELWKELEDRYDQTNGAKLYQIQKEIDDLTQGTLDITVYYTKLKKLWEELNTLNTKSICTCTCICGAKDSMHKSEQDRRLIQFLMGLNEVYTVIRGNILMMSPLPSTAQAFSLLIQEEKQREYRPTSRAPMESISLNANANAGRGSQTGRGYRTNFSSSSELNNSGNRGILFCDFCKKQGHIKEKCYKLHGYPPKNNVPNNRTNNTQQFNGQQFRQNNNQNFRGRRIVANAHGEECSQENSNSNAVITQEQYGHIMSLLQQFQIDGSGEDPKNNVESSKSAAVTEIYEVINMGDLPCPPYSNKRLEARMISKEKLPKICLVASATKHFSAKTLKCITKVKQSVQTSGTAGDVVIFLATTAVLEVVRRLSKARCPFIWHGLQALQALCYPPFKWVQKWVPLEPLVRQLQKLSRPMLLLSIATVFSDQSSSTGETTPNDFHHSQAYPQARSHDEVQDDGYPPRWLLELHKELREESISVPERLNDDELRQFYAAANGDFARLLSSVKKTIKWRQNYTFLSPEELKAWSPFIFWHGHDANQRPCLIIRLGLACSNLRSNGKSLLIKAVVSQIEHGILRMVNVEHPQITVLMSCEGLSPFGFPIHMMRSCAMLLQDHYPNRLSSLIIVRLPQVAQIIMQTFFQVLKPSTRQKVRIIGRNLLEFLSNHLDSIPPFLGGNCSCSKCSDQSDAESESDEATRTDRTPDQASRPETPDHTNESNEVTPTEPAADQVKDSPEFNHHNVSNTSAYREELIKTIFIGILMVWVFIAVIVAMDYPERWPLLRST